jgi:hypothetical protein
MRTQEEQDEFLAEQERKLGVVYQIQQLKNEAEGLQTKILLLEKIAQLYPDLKMNMNRWNRVRWYSKTVNSYVDKCEIGHSCGCCPDSSVEVWPYVEIDGFKVYSDPCKISVGEDSSFGDRPDKNWQAQFSKYGISQVIIDKVKEHFKTEKEEAEKRLEDYYDEE